MSAPPNGCLLTRKRNLAVHDLAPRRADLAKQGSPLRCGRSILPLITTSCCQYILHQHPFAFLCTKNRVNVHSLPPTKTECPSWKCVLCTFEQVYSITRLHHACICCNIFSQHTCACWRIKDRMKFPSLPPTQAECPSRKRKPSSMFLTTKYTKN